MKRNVESVRAAHNKSRKNKSRYAEKVKRGQMYGPGCCAHSITKEQVEAGKERARRSGVFQPRYDRAPPHQQQESNDRYLPDNFDPRPLVIKVGAL